MMLARFRNQAADLAAEIAQSHLRLPERANSETLGCHAILYPGDQPRILGVDLTIDPPVEIPDSLHLATIVGDCIADLTD